MKDIELEFRLFYKEFIISSAFWFNRAQEKNAQDIALNYNF